MAAPLSQSRLGIHLGPCITIFMIIANSCTVNTQQLNKSVGAFGLLMHSSSVTVMRHAYCWHYCKWGTKNDAGGACNGAIRTTKWTFTSIRSVIPLCKELSSRPAVPKLCVAKPWGDAKWRLGRRQELEKSIEENRRRKTKWMLLYLKMFRKCWEIMSWQTSAPYSLNDDSRSFVPFILKTFSIILFRFLNYFFVN
jgi:hypothetical protein